MGLHKTLMKNIQLVDPTLFFHDDCWWLFGNVKVHQGASFSDELFLYYADSPFSESWTPHVLNPIVSDARIARPAGKILQHDGKIYRVSQDCSNGYGYAVNFHEILELSKEGYLEQYSEKIEPLWDRALIGTHTFNTTHGFTIIDAKYYQRKLFR